MAGVSDQYALIFRIDEENGEMKEIHRMKCDNSKDG